MHIRFASVLVLAAAPRVVAACGSEGATSGAVEPAAATGATDAPPPTGPAEPSPTIATNDGGPSSDAPLLQRVSDGQILAILTAESEAHVDLATAVRARVQSASALDLAEKMITDDSVLEIQVNGEARETGIGPLPGGIDRAIDDDSRAQIQSLDAQSGPALDASYVGREALSHLRALGLIDHLLIPSVHDPRIGALLARVRAVVVQHTQTVFQPPSFTNDLNVRYAP